MAWLTTEHEMVSEPSMGETDSQIEKEGNITIYHHISHNITIYHHITIHDDHSSTFFFEQTH
jgi:hypothetical protein